MATLPQTLTPYHAKYYAYELTRRCPPDSDDRLANALVTSEPRASQHQPDRTLHLRFATGRNKHTRRTLQDLRGLAITADRMAASPESSGPNRELADACHKIALVIAVFLRQVGWKRQ
jgi:hypothetical protein